MRCDRKFEIYSNEDMECGGSISDWGSNAAPTYTSGCSSSTPTTCRWCGSGKHRAASGQCVDCEAGKYRDTVGGGACKTCHSNSDSAAGSSTCICNAGFYPHTGGVVAPNNTRLRLSTSWPELVAGQSRTPTFRNLVGTESICGRVEVTFELNWQSSRGAASYDPGAWGGVYSENQFGFGDNEANVVCRELGLSGGRHLPFNSEFNWYHPSSGPLWIKFDQGNSTGCNGTEATLSDCQYEFSETSFCIGNTCPGQNTMYYAQICCEGDLPSLSSSGAYVEQASCTMCAVGTYKSTNGSALCQYCPAGKYSDATGATS